MADPDETRQFESWLQTLADAFVHDNSNADITDSMHGDTSSIVECIKEALAEDQQHLPKYSAKKSTIVDSMVSTADDLKQRLRRICFPTVASRFNALQKEIMLSESSLEVMEIHPQQNGVDQVNELPIRDFLRIKLAQSSSVASLCRLADYGHRLDIVSQNDSARMDYLLKRETRRHAKYEGDLAQYNDSQRYFEGKDEDRILDKALTMANEQLQTLESNLSDALEEEERARKAYEQAVQRTQLAKKNTQGFENFVELMTTQAELMQKVNRLRIDIADFNCNSSTRRLNMLTALKDYVSQRSQAFITHRVAAECHALFDHLAQHFMELGKRLEEHRSLASDPSPSAFSSTDAIDSLACMLRVGIETLRVWNELGANSVYNNLNPAVMGLENFLREAISKVPTIPFSRPMMDVDGAEDVSGRPQTVVLYFDHVFHDTPDDHVESQARILTSLKLLRKRANAQSDSPPSSNLRTIMIQKCDDIISPPSWCLPLVHSPQYLAHLADLAAEAKADDLYVPLEFETEWETDDDVTTDDEYEVDTIKRRRRRSNVRSKRLSHVFDLHAEYAHSLDPDMSQMIRKLLTPRKMDIALASILREESNAPTASSARTNGEGTKWVDAAGDDSMAALTGKVKTPYGSGTIIEEDEDRSDGMVKVQLEWGAIGYMHPSILQHAPRRVRSVTQASTNVDGPKDAPNRFLCTDLRLHRRFRRILAQVGLLRNLVDKINGNDAMLSLWIHGRTAAGVNSSVESGIKGWLRRFDLVKLDELLTEREKSIVQKRVRQDVADNFFVEMEKLRLTNPPIEYHEPNMEMDDGSSYATLREEALRYSISRSRSRSRSGAARVRKPVSSNNEGNRGGGGISKPIKTERRQGGGGGFRVSRQQVWGKEFAPPEDIVAELLLTPAHVKMSELLRKLLFDLSTTLNLTQSTLAQELVRKYKIRANQRSVSGWVRYKMSLSATKKIDEYMLDWIVFHKKLLSSANQSKLEELQLLFAEVHGAAKGLDIKPAAFAAAVLVPAAGKDDDGDDNDGDDDGGDDDNNDGDENEEEEDENEDGGSLQSQDDPNATNADMEVEGVKAAAVEQSIPVAAVPSAILSHQLFAGVTNLPDPLPESAAVKVVSSPLVAGGDIANAAPVSFNISNSELYKVMMKELGRRRLTHSYAAEEISRLSYRMTQTALNKYSRDTIITDSPRGRMNRAAMINWLRFSRPRAVVANNRDENLFCSNCGKSKFTFPYQRAFLSHVGKCGKVNLKDPVQCKGLLLVADAISDEPQRRGGKTGADLTMEESVADEEDGEDNDSIQSYHSASEGHPKTDRSNKRTRESIDSTNVELSKRARPSVTSAIGDSLLDYEEVQSGKRPHKAKAAQLNDQEQDDVHSVHAPKSSQMLEGMTDTYVGSQSLQAALCAAGTACKAVDIVMTQAGCNAFACTRPPGHHAGRYGCTRGCLSTGFCLLNNAAIALTYARVRYGVTKIAVVDIDVHFGNGTADILRSDPNAFFASVHMVYGQNNDGNKVSKKEIFGFYPAHLGQTEINEHYVSIGVQPANIQDVMQRQQQRIRKKAVEQEVEADSDVEDEQVPAKAAADEDDDISIMSIDAETKPVSGSAFDLSSLVGAEGYLRALKEVIIPKMEAFQPELLIISAGFDGYLSDPLGSELKLSLDHYTQSTLMLTASMDKLARQAGQQHGGKVVSLLEGGYDTSPYSLGLARCVDTHVAALQQRVATC